MTIHKYWQRKGYLAGGFLIGSSLGILVGAILEASFWGWGIGVILGVGAGICLTRDSIP